MGLIHSKLLRDLQIKAANAEPSEGGSAGGGASSSNGGGTLGRPITTDIAIGHIPTGTTLGADVTFAQFVRMATVAYSAPGITLALADGAQTSFESNSGVVNVLVTVTQGRDDIKSVAIMAGDEVKVNVKGWVAGEPKEVAVPVNSTCTLSAVVQDNSGTAGGKVTSTTTIPVKFVQPAFYIGLDCFGTSSTGWDIDQYGGDDEYWFELEDRKLANLTTDRLLGLKCLTTKSKPTAKDITGGDTPIFYDFAEAENYTEDFAVGVTVLVVIPKAIGELKMVSASSGLCDTTNFEFAEVEIDGILYNCYRAHAVAGPTGWMDKYKVVLK